ncbi:MAG: hypothetical protein Kapaf2KO_12590 [Candidatus Kapaibacteriales bacterium]
MNNIYSIILVVVLGFLSLSISLGAGGGGTSVGGVLRLLQNDISEYFRLEKQLKDNNQEDINQESDSLVDISSIHPKGLKGYLKDLGHSVHRSVNGKETESGFTIGLTAKIKERTVKSSNMEESIRELLPEDIYINLLGKGPYCTIRVDPIMLERVVGSGLFERIEADMPVGEALDEGMEQSNISSLRDFTTGSNYRGKGVVFGLVDIGFDYTHKVFEGMDGRNRIVSAWQQGDQGGSTNWGYGRIYSGSQALQNRYDIENFTHGTHVAGIGAGNGLDGNDELTGVASESSIVMVTNASFEEDYSSTSHTTILDGIEFIFSEADRLDRPAVVNLSLATNIGPHDGSSLFDLAAGSMLGLGKSLVTASGNDGHLNMAIVDDFDQGDVIQTVVGQNPDFNNNFIDIWAEDDAEFCITLGEIDVSGRLTWSDEVVCTDGSTNRELSRALPGRVVQYNTGYTLEGSDSEGFQKRVFVRLRDHTRGAVAMRMEVLKGGRINIWNAGAGGSTAEEFSSQNRSGFISGDNYGIVGEIGGNSKDFITVGSYTSSDIYRSTAGNMYRVSPEGTRYSLSLFSSVGPTADGRIKPDISAPGNIVESSISKFDFRYRVGNVNSQFTTRYVSAHDAYFGAQSGTSMATPFVAGPIALMLEANPYLSQPEIKAILKETAYEDSYTGQILNDGNNRWGSGKLDIAAAVKRAEKLFAETVITPNIKFGPNPVDSKKELTIFFEEGAVGNFRYTISDLSGRIVFEKDSQISVSDSPIEKLELGAVVSGMYLLNIKSDFVEVNYPIAIQ